MSTNIAPIQTAAQIRAQVQALLSVQPDSIFGPKTRAAFDALATASAWPPVSASPSAPTVVQSGAIYGADTVDIVTPEVISEITEMLGVKPAFIARYVGSIYEYKGAQENAVLAVAGIPLLLIGDQTKRVGGTRAQGETDGLENAFDVLATFPSLSGEKYLALDCENDPPLSANYYAGWCEGVAAASKGTKVTFLPILYASEGAGESWAALLKAIAAGAPCYGVWSADYITTTASHLPIAPAWNPLKARMLLPDGSSPSAPPVLIWQTAGGFEGTKFEAHDTNMLNPSTDAAAFLARLISPTV